MPNTHSTLTALFGDIASAIRQKNGSSSPIIADAFPTAILGIPSADSEEDSIIEKTISGAYSNSRVSDIGSYAFYNCKNLSEVNFPNCVTIGSYAFYYCSNLELANFPLCKTIGESAFRSCTFLSSINFPLCEHIGSTAFDSCSYLISASFPVCESIPAMAFQNCYSLQTLYFPSCTIIKSSAFRSCSSLLSAYFPECSSIYASAFLDCSYLSIVSFPKCSNINAQVFAKCYRLKSAYFIGSYVPNLQITTAFASTPIYGYTSYTSGEYGSIIVQASMLDAFKSATNWSYFSSRFSIYNGID